MLEKDERELHFSLIQKWNNGIYIHNAIKGRGRVYFTSLLLCEIAFLPSIKVPSTNLTRSSIYLSICLDIWLNICLHIHLDICLVILRRFTPRHTSRPVSRRIPTWSEANISSCQILPRPLSNRGIYHCSSKLDIAMLLASVFLIFLVIIVNHYISLARFKVYER